MVCRLHGAMDCPEVDCQDFDFEPAEPSELGFDPYAGDYIEDESYSPYDDFDSHMIGGDSDLLGEY